MKLLEHILGSCLLAIIVLLMTMTMTVRKKNLNKMVIFLPISLIHLLICRDIQGYKQRQGFSNHYRRMKNIFEIKRKTGFKEKLFLCWQLNHCSQIENTTLLYFIHQTTNMSHREQQCVVLIIC